MCSCLTNEIMETKMKEMAYLIGVSVPVFQFLLCFVATIPVSFFHRFVPGGSTGKHLYAAFTGAVLSYLSFGLSSNMHFLVPMIISYGFMVFYRKRCGLITFLLAMGYLIGCHVYYMSGDAWKEGDIDATGALMVITLKVISCTINYNDGLLKEEDLRQTQKKNRLLKLPSFIEYVGYCLCCGSHFAGPVYEMKDYLDWTEMKGIWMKSDRPSPSPLGGTVKAILQAAFCMGAYIYLAPQYPLSRFTDPIYNEWGFMERLIYQYMCSFTARWKYYFIWSISEASMILSGLGFSGWTNRSPQKARWERAKNVDILGVEFAKSSVEIPLVWNIHVSTWLRHYVYDRLVLKGRKPGFFQLLATQTISAVWHGLYPGYMIFFVQSALMISGSKAIYRWQQSVPSDKRGLKKMLMHSNFAYTVLVLNYSAVGFMVLSLDETITAYGSVYFIGTIVPVVFIILGNIVAKPKPAAPRVRKQQ
ncbi:lysophospholipid acyltransferase 1-like [Cynara cardunculus var. scolymus]|uniref:lysophospholipid acyltransferase 1-like n=1 Tax=Cynara cardunculus var. scolymus TaxID=59895 RepID=UPI000D627CCC|nr:lysophospholipid acyltransferase 1-like [Cynara cardunculus var. scolymus]